MTPDGHSLQVARPLQDEILHLIAIVLEKAAAVTLLYKIHT